MATSLFCRVRALRHALVLVALGGVSFADVLVVAGNLVPGVDFTKLQDAIDAASPGDTVLVKSKPGSYGHVTVDGKALHLVADGPGVQLGNFASLFFTNYPALQVLDLPPGQDVSVRGFDMDLGVFVSGCAGRVWIDDVRVTGASTCNVGGVHGAEIIDSLGVTFTNCILEGQWVDDLNMVAESADGLRATGSSVQLFGCLVGGGWGQNDFGFTPAPDPGGHGMLLASSEVTLSGCTVLGGPGGLASDPCVGPNASGGAGVRFTDANSTLRVQASTIGGGFALVHILCPGQAGPAGPDFEGPGQVLALPGIPHSLRVTAPVREGEPLEFTLGGVPGELGAVLFSVGHSTIPFPAPAGVLLVDPFAVQVLGAGVVPQGGVATLSITAPNLGPIGQSLVLCSQAAFVDASPATWLGGGAKVVIVDDLL